MYDGGLFFGLYNSSPDHQPVEEFLIGIDLIYPFLDKTTNKIYDMKGFVISVPVQQHDHPLPATDEDIFYDVKLVNGSVFTVSIHALSEYVNLVKSLIRNNLLFLHRYVKDRKLHFNVTVLTIRVLYTATRKTYGRSVTIHVNAQNNGYINSIIFKMMCMT